MREIYKEMNGYNIARNSNFKVAKVNSLPSQNVAATPSLFESPGRHGSAVKVDPHQSRSGRPLNTPKGASTGMNDRNTTPEEYEYEEDLGYSRMMRSEFRKSRR